jgi:hypothetical protein
MNMTKLNNVYRGYFDNRGVAVVTKNEHPLLSHFAFDWGNDSKKAEALAYRILCEEMGETLVDDILGVFKRDVISNLFPTWVLTSSHIEDFVVRAKSQNSIRHLNQKFTEDVPVEAKKGSEVSQKTHTCHFRTISGSGYANKIGLTFFYREASDNSSVYVVGMALAHPKDNGSKSRGRTIAAARAFYVDDSWANLTGTDVQMVANGTALVKKDKMDEIIEYIRNVEASDRPPSHVRNFYVSVFKKIDATARWWV